ncbi:MAG: N-acetyltransferase [Bacteroidetes bacterium]|nr:MAG: N-acetyltransferase [Bacteroidota bacterium]
MTPLSPSSAPYTSLQTARLILRQLDFLDQDALYELRSNPDVNKYLDRPVPGSRQDVIDFIEKINAGILLNQSFYWAITLLNNSKLIGTICLWNFSKTHNQAEIGYELNPAYQGLGLMQEAMSKVVEFGFEALRLNSILASTHKENKRSIHLLEKYGFSKANEELDDPLKETMVYTLRRNNAFGL